MDDGRMRVLFQKGYPSRDAFVGAEGAEASNEGDHIKLVRIRPLPEEKIKTKT
mgnify:CR=1 FL=1